MNQQNPNEPTVDDFFDNVGGGVGAPTAKLKDVNDGVLGTIESQRVVDYVPFGKTDPERNKDGSIRKQLVVVLQTEQRNWAGVSKIPLVDRDNPNSGPKPPEEDDGKRAVYLPQWSNIQAAVAEAVRASNAYDGKNGPLRDGGRLGVKVIELKDTGKGNPLKIHAAMYEAPAASATFFNESADVPPTTTASTATPPAQTTPQEAPSAPSQNTQVDPWTGEAASGNKPPF